MSAAEPFKAAVPSESGRDQRWRGSLERSRAGLDHNHTLGRCMGLGTHEMLPQAATVGESSRA